MLELPALKLYCRYNELEQSNGFLEGWQKSMLNTARRAGAGRGETVQILHACIACMPF